MINTFELSEYLDMWYVHDNAVNVRLAVIMSELKFKRYDFFIPSSMNIKAIGLVKVTVEMRKFASF